MVVTAFGGRENLILERDGKKVSSEIFNRRIAGNGSVSGKALG